MEGMSQSNRYEAGGFCFTHWGVLVWQTVGSGMLLLCRTVAALAVAGASIES